MKTRLRNSDKYLYALIPILIFAIICVFAKFMNSYNHNQDMYVVAGVLIAQGKDLYKDFAFLQAPYLPLIYGYIYRLFNISSYYYLTAKLISFMFINLSTVLLYQIAQRVLKDVVLALIVASFFIYNVTITNAASELTNYIMPIFFSLTSFYVFDVSLSKDKVCIWGIVLSGFFISISIGTRLTYLPIIIPFIISNVYFVFFDQSATAFRKSLIHISFAFLTGMIIGLLPMFFFYLSAPNVFLFNNLKYHLINTTWRQLTGQVRGMSLFSKFSIMREMFFQTDNIILLVSIFLGSGISFSFSKINWQTIKQMPTGLFWTCFSALVAIPITLASTPSWPQYYAMPVSFLFLLLIYSYSLKTTRTPLWLRRKILFILLLVQLAYSVPIRLTNIANLTQREGWKGLYFHDISTSIHQAVQDNKTYSGREKIATISPILVIDADIPIYAELSTGSFLYRVGDLLSPEQRSQFIATSPNTITSLLDDEPPVAIVVGFGRDPYNPILEQPLIEYAVSHNYKQVFIDGFDGDLYVHP